MRISELFLSIQGEGLDIGLPTVFVRTAGCNLRCSWCDTTYALRGGRELAIEKILDRIKKFKCWRVCLTGGEPLMHDEVTLLIKRLLARGYELSVLTNGSLPLGPIIALDRSRNLHISMDVKCPSSKMHREMKFQNLARLRENDQVKFVVNDLRDYAHARRILKRYRTRATVIIQPVWGARGARIAEAVLRDKLDARVLVQMHKLLWGPGARGR
jgi:7-carboxy-7-deazaguanine synthase